jgi:spoIIIJ-associated protein
MDKEVIVSAATVEEAVGQALAQLGASIESVDVEVLDEPTKKIFGGFSDAKVKVTLLDAAGGDAGGTGAQEGVEDSAADDYQDEGAGEAGEDPDEDGFRTGDGLESAEEADLEDDEADEDEDADDDADGDGDDDVDGERDFNKEFKRPTEEELDKIADSAIEAVQLFLGYFGAEEAEIEEYEGDEGELILDIVGDNLAVLIGRHGKTLDSIQFLVSSIVSKKIGYRYPVIIDVEGYKHRRKQKLISIAKSSAARAVRNKATVRMRPMNPYERRIVHIALKKDKRVSTTSEGVEPSRYIVIQPL